MRLINCDMKDAGGAIVRFVNEQNLCGKSLNAGAILARAFEEWESRRGERDGATGRQGDGATQQREELRWQAAPPYPTPPVALSPRRPVASSLLRRVIPYSARADVVGLFDSDVEFAERAVAFFVGREEPEDVLGAQPVGEIGEGPVEFSQRRIIGLIAMPPPVREPGFEQLAAGLFGQRFESAFGGQIAQVSKATGCL